MVGVISSIPSGGNFITTCIRSMTGRYCFHRCLSVNISGGYPIQVWMVGGYTIPGLAGGVPHSRSGQGVTPSQVWPGGRVGWGGVGYCIPGLARGVPHPRFGQWGTQSQVWGYLGYPLPEMGYILQTRDGVPPQTWDGVPTGPGMGNPRHGMGYPPDLGWGIPLSRPGMGYLQTWVGYPPGLARGAPHSRYDWVVPHPRSGQGVGVTHPRSSWVGRGTPSQVWPGAVPHLRSGSISDIPPTSDRVPPGSNMG